MPAHITANSVMASAKRLIELRQLCLSSSKNGGDQRAGVADTDPPDEIDDGESPANGNVDAPNANALEEEQRDASSSRLQQAEGDGDAARATTVACRGAARSTLILSVTEPKLWPGSMTGAFSTRPACLLVSVRLALAASDGHVHGSALCSVCCSSAGFGFTTVAR